MLSLVVVGALYFALVVWAGMLWGSIWVLERDNPYNRFGHALIISAVRIAIEFAMIPLGYFGLLLAVAFLVVAVKLLMHHYELSIWKALAVIGLLIGTPFVVMPSIVEWTGFDVWRWMLVLYGMPTGILITWIVGRHRAKYRVDPRVPAARIVERAATDPKVAPVAAPTGPMPVRPTKPSGPQPVVPATVPEAAPVRVSQPIIPIRSSAPEIEAPAAPSDGPRFLR